MKDTCRDCGKRLNLSELTPLYEPSKNGTHNKTVWLCTYCANKIFDNKPCSYLSFPGIANEAYTPDVIIMTVCEYFKVTKDSLMKHDRRSEYVMPRHIAAFFIKKHFKTMGFKMIGEIFAGRNHATIINSIKVVNNYIDTDNNIKEVVRKIESMLLAKTPQIK